MEFVKKNIKDALKIGLVSLAIAFLAVLPTLIKYHGNLYLVGDYMTQLIPFMKEGRRLFLSGTPFWSWNSFFGANFIGSYSYYVHGNPLSFFLLLIPEKYIGVGITVLFLVKHFFAGFSAFLMFRLFFNQRYYAVMGVLLYVFSSFTFDSTYYYIFLDAIACFPLLILGIELIFRKDSGWLFTIAVFLNAVVNYYCFIGSSVFLIIYALFRLKSDKSITFKKDILRCIPFYVAGAFAAMYILLPSALTLLETSKALSSFSSNLVKGISSIPQIIIILKGIILPSEGLVGSANGLIFFSFCSNKAFLPFFGAFFVFASFYSKEKSWNISLLKFLFILTMVPFGNGLFNLFSNSSYTRWWYCLVFVMAITSLKMVEAAEQQRDLYKDSYSKSGKLILILGLVILFVPLLIRALSCYCLYDLIIKYVPESGVNYLVTNGFLVPFDKDDLRYFVVFVFLTLISYGSLYVFLKKDWLYSKKRISALVLALICAVSYCTYLTNDSNLILSEEVSTPQILSEPESSEVSYHSRTWFKNGFHNYSMIVNQPSIKTFNSFKSKATYEFSRLTGFDTDSVTKLHFSTEAIQNVLSVEKVVNKNGKTENAKYYCPFGYTYSYYIIDSGNEPSNSKKENNKRIEQMCSACFIDEQDLDELSYLLKPYDDSLNWKDSVAKNRLTACMDFEMTGSGFTAVSDGENERLVYFSVPNDNGWKVTVNGKECKIYSINGGMMGIIVPAGKCEIKAVFTPPGMIAGTYISAASMAVIVVYAAVYSFIKFRKKNKTQCSTADN